MVYHHSSLASRRFSSPSFRATGQRLRARTKSQAHSLATLVKLDTSGKDTSYYVLKSLTRRARLCYPLVTAQPMPYGRRLLRGGQVAGARATTCLLAGCGKWAYAQGRRGSAQDASGEMCSLYTGRFLAAPPRSWQAGPSAPGRLSNPR